MPQILEEQRKLKELLPFYINQDDIDMAMRYLNDSAWEIYQRRDRQEEKVDDIEKRRDSLEARIETLEP